MRHRSAPALLAVHGVRVLGGPSVEAIAARFGLAEEEVREHLLDAQAWGWVTRHDYFGESWSMTSRGRQATEGLLAAELKETGTTTLVRDVHRRFLPLNVRHGRACTDWQLRPERWDPLAPNNHTDPVWDDRVLSDLNAIDQQFAALTADLVAAIGRFSGYSEQHTSALQLARSGQHGWIDAPDRQSCQLVWIQFHEDLLASLGIPRGADNPG